MPKVSILLPFHDAKPVTLKRAVASAMNHHYDDYELVLVSNDNDEQNDDAAIFSDSLAFHRKNVKYVIEQQKGIAFALNAGLQHCTGEYIARMDADDIMSVARLKLQSDYLDQHLHIGLVSGLVNFESELAESKGYEEYVSQINSWRSEEDIYMHRFVESPFAHPSVMFRRELIEKFGGYSTAPVPEDYELWLRWMHHGVRMAKVPFEVLTWHDHASRLSRTHPNCSPEAFDTVRYHYLARWLEPRLSSLPPIYVWGGKLARKKVKLLEEQGIRIKGFIDVKQPEREGDFIHYSEIPKPGEMFIISMVSNRGKYAEVRDFLLERGYEFEKDFVLAR